MRIHREVLQSDYTVVFPHTFAGRPRISGLRHSRVYIWLSRVFRSCASLSLFDMQNCVEIRANFRSRVFLTSKLGSGFEVDRTYRIGSLFSALFASVCIRFRNISEVSTRTRCFTDSILPRIAGVFSTSTTYTCMRHSCTNIHVYISTMGGTGRG